MAVWYARKSRAPACARTSVRSSAKTEPTISESASNGAMNLRFVMDCGTCRVRRLSHSYNAGNGHPASSNSVSRSIRGSLHHFLHSHYDSRFVASDGRAVHARTDVGFRGGPQHVWSA